MDHLEYLKSGYDSAQKRFQEMQQRLQTVQAEFNVIAQEFNAWQTLYRAEIAKHGNGQLPQPPKPQLQHTNNVSRLTGSNQPSQTDAVRVLLKERPAGMTPSEIWKEVESLMANRTYLYSVLKRLKERGDVVERRGKYYPSPNGEGGTATIQ